MAKLSLDATEYPYRCRHATNNKQFFGYFSTKSFFSDNSPTLINFQVFQKSGQPVKNVLVSTSPTFKPDGTDHKHVPMFELLQLKARSLEACAWLTGGRFTPLSSSISRTESHDREVARPSCVGNSVRRFFFSKSFSAYVRLAVNLILTGVGRLTELSSVLVPSSVQLAANNSEPRTNLNSTANYEESERISEVQLNRFKLRFDPTGRHYDKSNCLRSISRLFWTWSHLTSAGD